MAGRGHFGEGGFRPNQVAFSIVQIQPVLIKRAARFPLAAATHDIKVVESIAVGIENQGTGVLGFAAVREVILEEAGATKNVVFSEMEWVRVRYRMCSTLRSTPCRRL